MSKTINDLYAESQMQLSEASIARYEACQVIAKLVRGELKPEWFTLVGDGPSLQWSYRVPDAPSLDVSEPLSAPN